MTNNNYTMGANGLALLKNFEKCELTSYQDEGGIWTIGWGHVDSSIIEGMTITQEQADAYLISDLSTFEFWVNKLVTVEINQDQFDSLCDFTYNEGQGRLQSSTLLKILNNGYFAGVPTQFLRWDIVNGEISNGLLHRRHCEAALFQSLDWRTITN